MQQGDRIAEYGEIAVSILIQPEGRMQHAAASGVRHGISVSILIQPEGRMQHLVVGPLGDPEVFQSSSSPKAGCNGASRGRVTTALLSFNPHPARRPDATSHMALLREREAHEFQSSSSPKAGCNARRLRWPCTARSLGFNPHPARRPDATAAHFRMRGTCIMVSILIQPEGRMQPDRPTQEGVLQQVSILIQPEGRMQRGSTGTSS